MCWKLKPEKMLEELVGISYIFELAYFGWRRPKQIMAKEIVMSGLGIFRNNSLMRILGNNQFYVAAWLTFFKMLRRISMMQQERSFSV